MQFSTIAFSALLALSQALTLRAESDNQDVNGKDVSATHEGAGINYAFLGQNGQDLTYDQGSQKLSYEDGNTNNVFGITADIVQFGVAAEDKVEFKDGYLSVVGKNGKFYAAKNINDPSRYSESSYAVLYTESPKDNYIEIKLKQNGAAPSSASSSAAPSSSGVPQVSEGGAAAQSFGGAVGLVGLAAMLL